MFVAKLFCCFYSNTCSVIAEQQCVSCFIFILTHIDSHCAMTAGTRRSVRWTVRGQRRYIFYIVCSKSLAKQGAERKLRQGCRLCRPRRRRVSPSYALFIFCVVDERKRRTKQLKPHKCLLLCG